MPQLYMILPVGGYDWGARPDQGLPQPPVYPSHGLPGYQPYPDQGLPGGQPYPDQGLPGGQGGRPSHPIYHPGHPDHGLPAYPDQGLPQPPPGGTPVEDYTPLPPPETVYSQYVVSVWNPKTASWTTKSSPPR